MPTDSSPTYDALFSFQESAERVKRFVLKRTGETAQQNQLYYHNCDHVEAVRQRAQRIFEAIAPYLEIPDPSLPRLKHLVDIMALAHDMVQEFLPPAQPYTPRRRPEVMGFNEYETVTQLLAYIEQLNDQIRQFNPNSPALFTDAELHLMREAIEATICLYDPSDGAIYQVDLYDPTKQVSAIARIIALADIGGLVMDGIEVSQQEGSLIFLEENPDVVPILWDETSRRVVIRDQPDTELQVIYENIRQRLLSRAQFQIGFARGRINRVDREIAGLPPSAVKTLKTEVFKYASEDVFRTIEAVTPTGVDTSLQELVAFFRLEHYLQTTDLNLCNSTPVHAAIASS
jgi:hypothetical protein